MATEAGLSQASPPASGCDGAYDNDPTASPYKSLRRACDCCRKRKVRCDGQDPCMPCKKASIRCAYLQPPKKKGPKGLRSARVLHALRKIDDSAYGSPTSSLSPESGAFGNWNWGSATAATPDGAPPYSEYMHVSQTPITHAPNNIPFGRQSSHQKSQHTMQLPLPGHLQPLRDPSWITGQAELPSMISRGFPAGASSEMPRPLNHRALSGRSILPYVQLFFDHMFPIMPVVDRNIFLNLDLYANSNHMSSEIYCFLCALCAATIVQLDASIPQPPPLHSCKNSDDFLAEECLRERKLFDYIDATSPLAIMTSFFLFAYNGNHERHVKAWHYLQESITFAENLNMDDEESYAELDPVEAQWRRRLYWLLFITERAYAVQRRKHTRLYANITLPGELKGEDPQLLIGFTNLANLFSAVDETFVSAWRGSRRASLCDVAWLDRMQKRLDATAHARGLGELTETQHLDISVTREWFHVLVWQMGVKHGLICWGQGKGDLSLDYPVRLARKVVGFTSNTSTLAIDSHGIGMEQKLSDIAGCLADVLRLTEGDSSTTILVGKRDLNILLQRLSSIRGKESRYLKPLMSRVNGTLGYELDHVMLPLPDDPLQALLHWNDPAVLSSLQTTSSRWSVVDPVGMLRSLSMSGNFGMPTFIAHQEEWFQRRPSGRVLGEDKVDASHTGSGNSSFGAVGA